jgi:hypothetical protein
MVWNEIFGLAAYSNTKKSCSCFNTGMVEEVHTGKLNLGEQ